MFTFRHAIAAVVAATALLPAPVASAAGDVETTISELAADAARLVAEEQQLVQQADPNNTSSSPSERADALARLQIVDNEGHTALMRLERLGVNTTEAIRTTLQRLPEGSTETAAFSRGIPPSVVYDAAVVDLRRIAATPDAVATGAPGSSRGPAIGLLVVGAGSLVALGMAALVNALRRRPADDEMAAMAWSDGLTGLANRRRLEHDLAAQNRARGESAAIMVDVDHLQSVNDAHGHQTGDLVLRQVSVMLSNHVRFDDVVYRYSGEEFCILLPGALIEEADRVAERIVAAARDIHLPTGDNITVSVGVATAPAAELAAAVEMADRALEVAKDRGRDRAVSSKRHLELA
jgi:diguanylate cyclase (GGDEF)-like protein